MSIIKNGSRDLVKNKESTSIYGSASFKLEGKSIIKDSEYNTEINKSFVIRSTSEQSLDKVINNERIYKGNNETLNKPQYFKNGYGDTGSRRELISRIEYPYKSSQYTRATIKREERINDRTYSLLNGKENNYKARKNSLIDDKRIDSIIKIKEVDTRGNSLRKNNIISNITKRSESVIRENNITSNITKRSEPVIRENGFKNSANYVNSKLDGIIRVREERVSETIIKNNIPNIKNYDIQGNRRKSLNIVRNDKLKAKGRYTNLIEDLKYTRSVNFSRVKKEFFKARYIRTIVDNGIDNLNSSDNDYGNTLAKEKMYRIVSAPRDLIRAGRSLKRAYN